MEHNVALIVQGPSACQEQEAFWNNAYRVT